MSQANVVFWMGEGLTPWLENSLANLAGSAKKMEMLKIEGTTLHDYRQGATFEAHDHHDEHQNEAATSEDIHNKEQHEKKHAGGHHQDDLNPYAWLDPSTQKSGYKKSPATSIRHQA